MQTHRRNGFPGSRLEADLLCKEAGVGGWRIFAIDRPGMGLSDFMRGRTLHDWPRDVEEFANALRIDHFTVIGVSGGGPYAAITAWALKKRVPATGIVCGLGPLQKGAEMGPFPRGALALKTTNCVPAAGITRDQLGVKIDKETGRALLYPRDKFRLVVEVNLIAPVYL